MVEGRFLPVTARESRVLSCSCCVRVHEYSFLPYLQCENDAAWLHQCGAAAVALIACTPDYVLGWYVARTENSRAWTALMQGIAPPLLVVSDGGGTGLKKRCAGSGLIVSIKGVLSTYLHKSVRPLLRARNYQLLKNCTRWENSC